MYTEIQKFEFSNNSFFKEINTFIQRGMHEIDQKWQ